MGQPAALERALDSIRHMEDAAPPWADILSSSSALFGSDGAAFIVLSGTGALLELQQFGADKAAEQAYVEHFAAQDILRAPALTARRGDWLDSQITLSKQDRQKNAYYVDFMCKYRMRHMRSLMLDQSANRVCAISFHRETEMRAAGALEGTALVALRSAWLIANRRREHAAAAWFRSVDEAFQAFGEAVFLVDQTGKIIHASPAAHTTIAGFPALRVQSGRLWHASESVRQAIAGAIHAVVHRSRSTHLIIPGEWGQSCSLEIARSKPSAAEFQSGLLLVRLKKRAAPGDVKLDGFIAAYGISAGESRVLTALMEGMTASQYSATHAVSINTVRKQIAMLMEKTGCRRQVELLRLVMG